MSGLVSTGSEAGRGRPRWSAGAGKRGSGQPGEQVVAVQHDHVLPDLVLGGGRPDAGRPPPAAAGSVTAMTKRASCRAGWYQPAKASHWYAAAWRAGAGPAAGRPALGWPTAGAGVRVMGATR